MTPVSFPAIRGRRAINRAMPAPVFISYTRPDKVSAQLIMEDLEADGVECWMATEDILGGEDYVKVIPPAIADARLVLLVLSTASLVSEHVYREVHLAIDDKKPILPVRIDPIGSVEGPLKYSLAGCQWVDAVPRLQPALPKIREEVRRLLARAGVRLQASTRSPFRRVLASLFAWTVVGGMVGLILWAIRSYWLNIVSWTDLLPQVGSNALTVAMVLAVPLLALGTQYFLHRRGRSVLTLDALFATKPKAALARTIAALGLLGLLALLVYVSPRTIQLSRTTVAPGPNDDPPLTQVRPCNAPFHEVSTHHYAATIRTGRLNPAGEYSLRLSLKYTEPDAVNFCDVWVTPPLTGAGKEEPETQSGDTLPPNRIRFIEIRRPRDAFMGSVRVVFSLVHPRNSPPRELVEGVASFERVGHAQVSSVPVRILATDWKK